MFHKRHTSLEDLANFTRQVRLCVKISSAVHLVVMPPFYVSTPPFLSSASCVGLITVVGECMRVVDGQIFLEVIEGVTVVLDCWMLVIHMWHDYIKTPTKPNFKVVLDYALKVGFVGVLGGVAVSEER